jgi:hypothetical protein
VHHTISLGPQSLRIVISDARLLGAKIQALADGQVAHRLTAAPSISQTDCLLIAEWLIRIVQYRRCRDRLELSLGSGRAAHKWQKPLLLGD